MLGVGERSFRRWSVCHRDDGVAGLRDCRLGPAPLRVAPEDIERMLGLYRDVYQGLTVKHFHEKLLTRHNYKPGYKVTKLHLQRTGLVTTAKRRWWCTLTSGNAVCVPDGCATLPVSG